MNLNIIFLDFLLNLVDGKMLQEKIENALFVTLAIYMRLGYPDDGITQRTRVPGRISTKEFKDFLNIYFPALKNVEYDLAYGTQNDLYLVQGEINTRALIKEYLVKFSQEF